MKKIEELLEPRFKVIADYPKSLYKVGDILRAGGRHGDIIYCDTEGPRMSQYPHLFKKLRWDEERTREELPDYVRWDGNGATRFYKKEFIQSTYRYKSTDGDWYLQAFINCTPATESDYLTYTAKSEER